MSPGRRREQQREGKGVIQRVGGIEKGIRRSWENEVERKRRSKER